MTSPLTTSSARPTLSPHISEQLLHDLVSIPSPSGEESQAVNFLVAWMQAHGYHRAFVDEAGNAVGIIGDGERDIVLLGHIDTFGGNLSVHVNERKLYGRGTVDAKGALCAFTVAGAQAIIPDGYRLVVIGAVEEEASTSKGARFAVTQYQPDYCIIGEPSQFDRITLGYKGRLIINWHWRGALAHSASDVLSPSEHAVHDWQTVQAHVQDYNQAIEGIFHRLDVKLQQINSGQDGAYGWASMTIGFRLPPSITPQTLIQQLQLLLNPEATCAFIGQEIAYVGDKDTHLSRTMRSAIRSIGARPRFVHKTGTADMNVVAPHWQCPMIAYGAGDSSLDHTPDEHIHLDEYQNAIQVLTTALSTL